MLAQLAKTAALVGLALGMALLGYGTVVEPYTIGREDETVSIPGLPSG